MGTLYQQDPRNGRHTPGLTLPSVDELRAIRRLAEQAGMSVSELTGLLAVFQQARANDLAWDDGDIRDEQLAGLGELLGRVAEALERLGGKA